MRCSIAFQTMVITIATGIMGHLIGTFLELFQNNIRNVVLVCSRTVPDQTFLGNSLRKVLDACSRTVGEQTIRILLEMFYNHT